MNIRSLKDTIVGLRQDQILFLDKRRKYTRKSRSQQIRDLIDKEIIRTKRNLRKKKQI